MKKKEQTMPKRLESVQNEIRIIGGDAILLYANEDLNEACACVALSDVGNIVPLMTSFLHRQPTLIPKVIKACALAMELPDNHGNESKCDGDCDNCADDNDDGSSLLDNMSLN